MAPAATINPYRVVNDLREITDEVLVGVGGKDSMACLELLYTHQNPFRRIALFFMRLVPDLSFQEKYLRYVERRYKLEILRLPTPKLSHMFQGGTYRPLTNVAINCPTVTEAMVEDYARKKAGIKWVAGGHKICDSLQRRLLVGFHHGIDVRHYRAYPLAYWSNSAVYTFLRERGIALPPEYRFHLERGHSFRNELSAKELGPIKKHFPQDYARIKEYFPYVDATFIHESDGPPKVRRQDHRADADQPAAGQPADDRRPRPEQAGEVPA